MTVKAEGNGVRFIFKGTGVRSQMLLIIQTLVMFGIALLGLVGTVSSYRQEKYLLSLLCTAFAGGFFYMSWRILARITKKEQLHLTAQTLTLTSTVNGRKETRVYPLDQIQNLCYLGAGTQAEHPLASDNLDALGFGMRQGMVNAVVAEGAIAFYHNSRMIRFGIGVSSWNAETIDKHLRELTADSLSMGGLPQDIPDEVWNK